MVKWDLAGGVRREEVRPLCHQLRDVCTRERGLSFRRRSLRFRPPSTNKCHGNPPRGIRGVSSSQERWDTSEMNLGSSGRCSRVQDWSDAKRSGRFATSSATSAPAREKRLVLFDHQTMRPDHQVMRPRDAFGRAHTTNQREICDVCARAREEKGFQSKTLMQCSCSATSAPARDKRFYMKRLSI